MTLNKAFNDIRATGKKWITVMNIHIKINLQYEFFYIQLEIIVVSKYFLKTYSFKDRIVG